MIQVGACPGFSCSAWRTRPGRTIAGCEAFLSWRTGTQAKSIARGAADWLVDHVGLEGEDPSLYHGRAGVLLALEEAAHVLGDDRYARAVADGLRKLSCALSAAVEDLQDSSLYFELAGLAFAFGALGRPLSSAGHPL